MTPPLALSLSLSGGTCQRARSAALIKLTRLSANWLSPSPPADLRRLRLTAAAPASSIIMRLEKLNWSVGGGLTKLRRSANVGDSPPSQPDRPTGGARR